MGVGVGVGVGGVLARGGEVGGDLTGGGGGWKGVTGLWPCLGGGGGVATMRAGGGNMGALGEDGDGFDPPRLGEEGGEARLPLPLPPPPPHFALPQSMGLPTTALHTFELFCRDLDGKQLLRSSNTVSFRDDGAHSGASPLK